MSIFKKDTVIESYNGFDVVSREADSDGAINLTAGETLVLPNHRGSYTIHSVVSYALESGRDPIADYEREVSRGHATHWINANCTTITAHERERERHIEVNYGTLVRFEGRMFKIALAPNRNLKLVAA